MTPFATPATTSTGSTGTTSAGEYSLDAIAAALTAVGVSAEELSEIWSVLAVVLHLGNIQCQSVVTDGPQVDENYQQVLPVSNLLCGVILSSLLQNFKDETALFLLVFF